VTFGTARRLISMSDKLGLSDAFMVAKAFEKLTISPVR
jgi:hypothetical protein